MLAQNVGAANDSAQAISAQVFFRMPTASPLASPVARLCAATFWSVLMVCIPWFGPRWDTRIRCCTGRTPVWRAVAPCSGSAIVPGESWGCGRRFGILPVKGGRVYWFCHQQCPGGRTRPALSGPRDRLARAIQGMARTCGGFGLRHRRTAPSCEMTFMIANRLKRGGRGE